MRNDEIRTEGNERLLPLSNSKDFKVAKDNPDVRGWRVVGADGDSLGIVKDLIVDTQEMKVRYLALTADKRFYKDNYDRYLLVPIGAAALDKKGNNVFVSNIDSRTILNYPTYQGGPITEDYEYAVRQFSDHSNSGQPATDRNINANTADPRLTDNPSDARLTDSTSDARLTGNNNTTSDQAPVVAPQRISSDFYKDDSFNENRFYTPDSNNMADNDNNRRGFGSDNANRGFTTDNDNRGFASDNVNTDVYPGRTDVTDGGSQNVGESISTIERLEQLRERGSITEEEFRVLKKRALDL